MKFKVQALAAAVAFAVAGTASAAIDMPNSDVNNTGGSELMLTVFDTNTGTSFTRDLGVGFQDAVNTLGGGGSYNFAADADLNSTFDLVNNQNLIWSVVAADAVFTGTGLDQSTYGTRMLSTAVDENAINGTNFNVSQSTLTANDFVISLNGQSNHNSVADGYSVVSSGSSAQWQDSGMNNGWDDPLGFSATDIVGNTMSFVMLAETSVIETGRTEYVAGDPGGQPLVDFMAFATLNADGSLNISNVPVPAAVWLLGSAMLGLLGLASRRKDEDELEPVTA
jgi:hypothetical protein